MTDPADPVLIRHLARANPQCHTSSAKIVADREALRAHFKHKLQESALPPLHNLEERGRHDVLNKLEHATRECSNSFKKGNRSFEVLARLNPAVLKEHLPSFVRVVSILEARL